MYRSIHSLPNWLLLLPKVRCQSVTSSLDVHIQSMIQSTNQKCSNISVHNGTFYDARIKKSFITKEYVFLYFLPFWSIYNIFRFISWYLVHHAGFILTYLSKLRKLSKKIINLSNPKYFNFVNWTLNLFTFF